MFMQNSSYLITPTDKQTKMFCGRLSLKVRVVSSEYIFKVKEDSRLYSCADKKLMVL